MTPQQMLNTANQIQQRWPNAATISGRYANATVTLEVVVDGLVVAWVSCFDGSIHELITPTPVNRTLIQF